jgi:MFS family permease
VLIAGLGLIAMGSFMGAASFGMTLLIVSRVVEGVGFLAVAIAGPTLLRTVVSDEDRPLVLSTWSSYIPVGAALMMVAGPFIMQGEWRILWLFNGAAAAAHAVLVAWVRPASSQTMPEIIRPDAGDVMAVLRTRRLQLLAFAFLLYTTQYFALATFLPVFLVGRLGFSLSQAGTISAIALSANAVGNILAGLFLKRGVPLWAIITAAFLTIGITGFGIFLDASPVLLVFAAAGLCFGVSALLPASIISTVPQYAPSSRRLALAMGVIQQSSGFGQMIGPALIALWVQQFSWNAVPYMFAAIAALGLAAAILMRKQHRES